ncbi:MAG: DUF6580 family putative transport protein [Bacteroidota bacterium]
MNKRFTLVAAIVFLAAISRLLPHLPNFTPIGAMALFAGAYITNRFLAFITPLAAMLLSDALMGFNGWYFTEQTIAVYATFMLITLLGLSLQNNKSVVKIGLMSISSSLLFFVVTNLFVWIGGFYHKPELYPLNTAGLMECYTMAIPFFDKTLASDLFYNAILFGGFYLLQINIPSLKTEKVRS